jgi:hypothetical protein
VLHCRCGWVLSFVPSFYGNCGTKFLDKVPAEYCLVLFVRDCVFVQIGLNVQPNMNQLGNGNRSQDESNLNRKAVSSHEAHGVYRVH